MYSIWLLVIPGERCVFLEELANTLSGCASTDILIVGGDFNCTADDVDRNHVEPSAQSRKILKRIIETYELADVWQSKHGDERQYSWAHIKDCILWQDWTNSILLNISYSFLGHAHCVQ